MISTLLVELWLLFCIVEPKTLLFGMISRLLSGVSIEVAKRPISFTVPDSLETLTKSPTLNGLNSRSITPEAKCARVSFSARPTAKPAVPRITVKFVVSIPRMDRQVIATTMIMIHLIEFDRNIDRVRSSFALCIAFLV